MKKEHMYTHTHTHSSTALGPGVTTDAPAACDVSDELVERKLACVCRPLPGVGCFYNQHSSTPWSQGKLSTVSEEQVSPSCSSGPIRTYSYRWD